MNSRMKSVPQSLQRVFWSLYGRLAWDAARSPWKATQVRQIVEILKGRQVVPAEWVLDAGCGTGDFSLALAKAGFQVIGADYAEGMLARARAKMTGELANSLSFEQVDLNRRLNFPDARFDHVINISVLQVAAEPTFTLGELWRVLRPGGTLALLHVPQSDSYNLPLREAIRHRIQDLEMKTLWRVALVATKVWAERTGSTRFWTAEALQEMLKSSHFRVLSVDQGPPIVIVARRTESEQNPA
jgi:ubiquinone/menaquinone biosynthesis C-methylase UbiE